eukprot:s395_g5.t1
MIYAMTIYGYPGAGDKQPAAYANNEALFTAAFDALATLGSVPIVLGGDFNTEVENSDVLRSALGTGQYFDVLRWKAHSLDLEPEGTNKLSGNRIGYMLFNREAFAAFMDGGVLHEPSFPVHLPVFADLQLGCFKQHCLIRHVPAPIPSRQDLAGLENQLFLIDALICNKVHAIHSPMWEQGLAQCDVDKLFQIWCERAEAFLLLEASLPFDTWTTYTGRSSPKKPKQGYVCKRSTVGLEGAQFADAKKLSDLCGKLKELQRQMEAAPTSHFGCAGTIFLRTWKNAQALAAKLQFDPFPEMPSAAFLQQAVLQCDQRLEKLTKQRQQERVATWKDKLRHDWFQSRRKVFQWMRNEPFSSLSLLQRHDGSLTGNLQEIDQLVQSAWRAIFSKYADTPEPSWETFRARFGQYIRAAPFELSPITGEKLAAAAKKQSTHTAMGADGWRASELKRLPLFCGTIWLRL